MNGPYHYEIRVEHHLGASVAAHFPEFALQHQKDGNTLLFGGLPDQAALHGVLARIRDLGLTLISIKRTGEKGTPGPS